MSRLLIRINYFKVLTSFWNHLCFLWAQFCLSIFLCLVFGWSQICNDPWLPGHVDKWRAGLSNAGACRGCGGLRSLGGWVDMLWGRPPWRKPWGPLSLPFLWRWGWCVKGSSVFHSWIELSFLPYSLSLCLSQRSGLCPSWAQYSQ